MTDLLLRRVGFTKDKYITYSSSSYIYHFIDLYLMYKERKRDNYKRVMLDTMLISGAPYEKALSDGIMSISDEIIMASNPFRFQKNEEAEITDEEMFELHDIVNRI